MHSSKRKEKQIATRHTPPVELFVKTNSFTAVSLNVIPSSMHARQQLSSLDRVVFSFSLLQCCSHSEIRLRHVPAGQPSSPCGSPGSCSPALLPSSSAMSASSARTRSSSSGVSFSGSISSSCTGRCSAAAAGAAGPATRPSNLGQSARTPVSVLGPRSVSSDHGQCVPVPNGGSSN